MADIQADYIKFTAPEIQGDFVAVLKKVPLFSSLTDDLIRQLFEYAKFVQLTDKDQLIQAGKFGQNIYILIQGRLEVFIEDEVGFKQQMDVIFRPFTVFGEQCVMGEPYSSSFEARGDALLLAIDMSVLPDLFEGWEHPDSLMEDDAYEQSLDLNIIIASVLLNRLNRLIKDQYKLVQKLVTLHQSADYQESWRKNVMLTTIFNEFTQGTLSSALNAGNLLRQTFEIYTPDEERINHLLGEDPVNTEKIYLELARLESLGKIDSVNILVMDIVQRLASKALRLEEYTLGLELEPHNLPAIISLSEYLNEAYFTVIEYGVLDKEITKEQFLDGFLSDTYPDPGQLVGYLRKNGFVDSVFRVSYLMVLISQTCIRKEYELSKLISKCVSYLTQLNSPRQNVKSAQDTVIQDSQSVTTELVTLYEKSVGKNAAWPGKQDKPASPQDDVEDLLSQFNL